MILYEENDTEIEEDIHNFTYDNYNRISSIDDSVVTYDDETNKISMLPKSLLGMNYQWEGRLLVGVTFNQKSIKYKYDERGLRIYKSVTENNKTIKYEYIYDDAGKLITEKRYENINQNVHIINYIYHNSILYGFYYDNEPYLYLRDSLGIIHGIIDKNGDLIHQYKYTAYGRAIDNHNGISNNIGVINPFRYEGYYYDEETGLFYCNSRYYSPELCRFISPDSVEYLDPQRINGLNLYCYCYNNPVMYSDGSGHFPVLACILGLTALVGLGLTIGGVASDNNLMTAIGLTMVAIPALISGGMGLACFGAWGTMAVGGVTALAGVGTGLFASAEYQEAFTGGNWIMDTTGMSDELYNGLMLSIAAIATAGTIASMAGITKYQNFGNSNWLNGWRKMRHHYWKHGIKEMKYGNIYKYTNSARNIITNGNYIAQRNAYAMLLNGNKVAFVGVGQGNTLITTYYYKTLTIRKLIEYGLIVS